MSHYFPTFDDLSANTENTRFLPVCRRLSSDALTPVEAYARLRAAGGERTFLFESVVGGERIGRYSFLGADPFFVVSAIRNEVTLLEGDSTETLESEDPLSLLEEILKKYPAIHWPGLPRFCGGAVGYAGYDTVRYVENLPNAPEDDRQFPDLLFGLYRTMLVFDHLSKSILVITLIDTTEGELEAGYKKACQEIDQLVEQLLTSTPLLKPLDVVIPESIGELPPSNTPKDVFKQAVESSKEYINAGDIFQVVLSQRLQKQTTASAMSIYRSLRIVNPSPFMFLIEMPEVTLIGSSPEIMVRVEDQEITVRPLAGTRKRGATEAEDQQLAEELLADPKERAEHVMLVDLARNDIGRVAKYGSVRLSDVMVVERYSHVMHITSNSQGTLRDELSAFDGLKAALPAGTVSGAPKVRAMEIIDELECNRRGPYAGAVGYIDFTGNMDTCIALRTLVMKDQTAYVQAGAGIVADSVPEMEYQETLNKARGLLTAIAMAESWAEPTQAE